MVLRQPFDIVGSAAPNSLYSSSFVPTACPHERGTRRNTANAEDHRRAEILGFACLFASSSWSAAGHRIDAGPDHRMAQVDFVWRSVSWSKYRAHYVLKRKRERV